jgi:hypothetical protein
VQRSLALIIIVSSFINIGEDLNRNVKFTAVVEGGVMVVGNPGGARVEI